MKCSNTNSPIARPLGTCGNVASIAHSSGSPASWLYRSCRLCPPGRTLLALLPTVLLTVAAVQPAAGQVVDTHRTYVIHHSVVDALAARVYAQGELLRARGEMSVSFAEARAIRAKAISQEIENSLSRVDAYWDARSRTEAELLKRKVSHLGHERIKNSKAWERLRYHPELSEANIPQAEPLNFLLHRLSSTVLAYRFSQTDSSDEQTLQSAELSLTPDTLRQLNLRQAGVGRNRLIFRADEGIALDVDWWPYDLRDPHFDKLRAKFKQARQTVVDESRSGKASFESIQALDVALLNLYSEFELFYRGQDRTVMENWSQYRTAESFLKDRIGEVGRLKRTGSVKAFDGSMQFTGDGLIALLKHMSHHGLEFAPATQGNEDAYFNMFCMMRDLYGTVADGDFSLNADAKH